MTFVSLQGYLWSLRALKTDEGELPVTPSGFLGHGKPPVHPLIIKAAHSGRTVKQNACRSTLATIPSSKNHTSMRYNWVSKVKMFQSNTVNNRANGFKNKFLRTQNQKHDLLIPL